MDFKNVLALNCCFKVFKKSLLIQVSFVSIFTLCDYCRVKLSN